MVHVIHVPTPLELPCALRDSFGGLALRRPSLGPMAAANQGSIAVALSKDRHSALRASCPQSCIMWFHRRLRMFKKIDRRYQN